MQLHRSSFRTMLLDPHFSLRSELLVRNPHDLPWVPWAMTGAQFKLMSANPESGRCSLMIRLEKGCMAPRHRHVGAVEGLDNDGRMTGRVGCEWHIETWDRALAAIVR